MRRSPQFAACLPRPALARALALCVLAASCLPVHAQNGVPAPASAQPASTTLPTVPSAAPPSGMAFNPAGSFTFGSRGPLATSAALQGPFGLSPFGVSLTAERPATPAPFFPIGYGLAPLSLSSLNGLLRGNVKLPHGPPAPSLRFTYQAPLAPGGFFSSLDIRKMINTGMYTSPNLGNGVHFSAGTDYNAKSVTGSHKPTGPSVNIKLTF